MKKFVTLSCILAISLCATVTARAQVVKIGTVDMEKIFKNYYKTKDAETRINEARTGAKKDLDARMDTYKEAVDDIKKLTDELANAGLSDAKKDELTKAREEKISEYKNLDREITEFRDERAKMLQEQAVRMRDDIVSDIMKIIQTKIKTEGYDYVFDKSGPSLNGVPILIYARDSVDFTDDVITALNKAKPKDSSTGASPSLTPKSTVQPP